MMLFLILFINIRSRDNDRHCFRHSHRRLSGLLRFFRLSFYTVPMKQWTRNRKSGSFSRSFDLPGINSFRFCSIRHQFIRMKKLLSIYCRRPSGICS